MALVDWPSQDVPRALLAAGCAVMSVNHMRGTASSYGVEPHDDWVPASGERVDVIRPERSGDGALLIRRLDALPSRVDIVYAFRPAPELAAIAELAVELHARALWVEGPAVPDDARATADAAGITVVEGTSIVDAAARLGTD